MTRAGAPGLRAALAPLTDGLGEEAIVQEVAEMQTLIGLVAAGVGISLVPESVRALARAGVVYRPLAGEAPTVALSACWRTGDDSPVLAAFLDLMP
jgi:DNA-binding transcriptional LysR family regulator